MARQEDRPEFSDREERSRQTALREERAGDNGGDPEGDLRLVPRATADSGAPHQVERSSDAAAWPPSSQRGPLQTFRLEVRGGPPVAASSWSEDDAVRPPRPDSAAVPEVRSDPTPVAQSRPETSPVSELPTDSTPAPELRSQGRPVPASRDAGAVSDSAFAASPEGSSTALPSASDRDPGDAAVSPGFAFPEHAAERAHGGSRWDIPALPVRPALTGADSLTADRIIRSRRARPDSGWRKSAYALSRGLINLGPSAADRERAHLLSLARSHVTWCHRLAVISLKGGVGKTTTTAALGSMLAELRGDRVIAVDANPDRGTLGERVPRDSAATVRHLLQARHQIQRYADVRKFTSQAPSRLEVLASDSDPGASLAYSEQDYRDTVSTLERFYSLLLTDCGTGLLHSAMAGILNLADSLIVVSSSSLDGARSASATLDWLEAHGFHDLAAEAVVVISSVRPKSGIVDIGLLHDHFAERCREVVRIPYDPHLEAGGIIDLDQMKPVTREAYLELAAVVGQGLAASY